jgi:hypothetical protein
MKEENTDIIYLPTRYSTWARPQICTCEYCLVESYNRFQCDNCGRNDIKVGTKNSILNKRRIEKINQILG